MRQVICDNYPSGNGELVLEGKLYTHLAMSLRKKVGERINLRLPSAELFESEIVSISKDKLVCRLHHRLDETPFPLKMVLLQWELKADKMDAVIRSATEIGVQYILPVIGSYCVPRTKNEKEKVRRENIVRSAREQSGSPVDTQVLTSLSLPLALKKLDELTMQKNVRKLLAYEKKETRSKSVFSSIDGNEKTLIVAIGAEGGIAGEECELLKCAGFDLLHFEGNVLRAQTASVYALASLKEAYYEKNKMLR